MRIGYLSVFLMAMLSGLGLTACDGTDGPAEQAGEDVDRAMDNAGDRIEDAGDKVEDATDR